MDSKKLFEKYYSRLRTEAILKSLVCGLLVGFGVDFIVAFVTWFFVDLFNLWFLVALGSGLIVGVIVAIFLYYKAFKPTPEKIAARIDELGLEERAITMYRYSDDESFIAQRQREDAKAKMSSIGSKSLKIIVARSLIIAAAIVGAVGLSMTTVSALVGFGVIDNPVEGIIPQPQADYVTVVYEVSDILAGHIEGEPLQILERGQSTEPVFAMAEDGYVFLYWEEDHNYDLERYETDVQYDLVFTAVFEEVTMSINEGDEPSDMPDEDPPPDEHENDGEDDEYQKGTPGQNDPPELQDYHFYKDGKTPFWSEWDDVYPQVMEDVASDPNLTDEERAFLQSEYNSLNSSVSKKDEDN